MCESEKDRVGGRRGGEEQGNGAMESLCRQVKLLKEEAGGPSPLPRHSPICASEVRSPAAKLRELPGLPPPGFHFLASPEHSSCLEHSWSCTGVSQELRPNNAALCGLWPRCYLVKARVNPGTAGRETWPAHPPVPFSAPGVRLSSRQRSSTVGPRNVCGHLAVSGACLRELASSVPAPGERTASRRVREAWTGVGSDGGDVGGPHFQA